MTIEDEIVSAAGLDGGAFDAGTEAPPFSIVIHRDVGRAHVVLLGELDMATAPELHERLLDLIAQRPGDVVLDLASLRFIDSSGLAVVVAADKVLGAQDANLILRSPAPMIQRVIEITGLDAVLRIDNAP